MPSDTPSAPVVVGVVLRVLRVLPGRLARTPTYLGGTDTGTATRSLFFLYVFPGKRGGGRVSNSGLESCVMTVADVGGNATSHKKKRSY